MDSAQDFLRRQHQQGQDGTAAGRQSGIVPGNNNLGYDCGRFDILALDGALIAPADNPEGFKNQVALVGLAPG